MMAKIIDGKAIANEINDQVKSVVDTLEARPRLAMILVGDDPASKVYVRRKSETCRKVGMETISAQLDPDISEDSLLGMINGFNESEAFHGILVQLPLPEQINVKHIIEAIEPAKDVDGFNPVNIGRMSVRSSVPYLHPCTPWGIMHMLDTVFKEYEGHSGLQGKRAAIIGQSNIVGRPLSIMLQNEGATCRLCDKYTPNLEDEVRGVDIIVSATGIHGVMNRKLIEANGRSDVTLVDAGITKVNDKVVGDADPEVYDMVGAYTPVPGGVGPVTVAFLMRNVLKAYYIQKGVEPPPLPSASGRT